MSRVLRHRALRRLAGNREGVAAVEFALAAPVLLILLMGMFDLGHMVYISTVLRGAVQQVARDGTLETADTTSADAFVSTLVKGVAPGATVTSTRQSYYDFADLARPEAWNDKDSNGTCNDGETYTDENKNGEWDDDIGQNGNGGANDVVLYTVKVTYSPLFPVPYITDRNSQMTISATAVKKNQPYALQENYGSSAGVCP